MEFGDNLNPEHLHKLTEQECMVLTYFRMFTKPQKEAIYKSLFFAALHDERIMGIAEDRKKREWD